MMFCRAALIALVASGASAKEQGAESGPFQILSCDMGKGRILAVHIDQGVGYYSFGPAAAPEISLAQDLRNISGTAWNGIGRSIWEDITFENKGYSYRVWYAIDRLVEGHPTDGGVAVLKDNQEVASLECVKGTAEDGGFGVSDGFEAAGLCWNPEVQRFEDGCD